MSIKTTISIVMITYNHEKYLKEAIEGILKQECEFEIELIIANDCSPDNTDAVVQEVINLNRSGVKINYIKHDKNIGMMHNFLFALNKAKGKYIALCDGDDYWLDPLKLQKQVRFLEENHDYGFVTSGFVYKNTESKEETISLFDVNFAPNNSLEGFDITIDVFFKKWVTKTLTVVFRKELFDAIDFSNYKYLRDVHLFYHLVMQKKGYYFKQVFAVYQMHRGGMASMIDKKNKVLTSYHIYKELYENNKNKYCRKNYFFSIRGVLIYKIIPNESLFLVFKMLSLARSKKDILLFLKTFYRSFFLVRTTTKSLDS